MPKGNGKPIPQVEVPKKVSAAQAQALLKTAESRFKENMYRHQGLQWSTVRDKLNQDAKKLTSLYAMEQTGGEPDVVGYDQKTGEFIFVDCSKESPDRRSICYDKEGENERIKKGINPGGNAIDLAKAMGIELLTEIQYRRLQELGEFDTKTESWIKTPSDIRKLGGALFCDRRYGHVFVFHNTAKSFYASRGFRGALRV